MQDKYDLQSNVPALKAHVVRMVGGSSAVTKVYGPGVAVTRTDTGDYTLTWSENPGTFIGATYGLSATTISDLAGHTVVFGAYGSSDYTLDLTLANASDAAHDLAALEWITVVAWFSETGAIPG